MKIIKSVFLLVVFFIFATNQNAYSQDEVRAEKHENISWVRIGLVTFKPGKASAARDIIYNHFAKAGKATGNPTATSFELTAGEWHQLTIFPMNGPSDLEYLELHKMQLGGTKWQNKKEELIKLKNY